MTAREFRHIREAQLGLSQDALARRLGLVRLSVLRYENGQRRIPRPLALALQHLAASPPRLPLIGLVAAGAPIEPIRQYEEIDIPPPMRGRVLPGRFLASATRLLEAGLAPRRSIPRA